MANKKTASTKKKSAPAKKTAAQRRSAPPPATAPVPIRREVTGILFMLCGVFLGISYFNNDGLVIRFISDFVKGLIGYGYWVSAPVCFLCAAILFMHHGRPVRFRVAAALLLPIFFGALTDLLVASLPLFKGVEELVPLLFVNGQHLQSGGAIGGLLSYALRETLSQYGALLVLVVAFLFFLLRSLNTSLLGLAGTVNTLARAEYPEEDYAEVDVAQPLRNAAAAAASVTRTAASLTRNATKSAQNFLFPEINEEEEYVFPDLLPERDAKGKKTAPASPAARAEASAMPAANPAGAKTRRSSRPAAQSTVVDIPLAGDDEDAILPFGMEGAPSRTASASRSAASRGTSAASRRSAEPVSAPSYADVPITEDAFDAGLDVFASPSRPAPAQTRPAAPAKRPAAHTASRTPIQTMSPSARMDNVEPLSEAEAAELAGITLEEPVKPAAKPARSVKVSAAGSASPERSSRKSSAAETKAEEVDIAAQIAEAAERHAEGTYQYPPSDLLRCSVASRGTDRTELAEKQYLLENALHSFGVPAEISNVINGPTVTRYDFKLKEGVKLSKITNLSNDIALALGVINVRIAPVPDQIAMVGIEVPNKIVSTVYLRDLVESDAFTKAKSKLTFSLGKDIGGNCIVGNISKLPHLLIAGTTGSGKSVCMNSLILSILYKASPEEVKFIMIDPKMVELGIYNGIPHLYVPVVTDPKKAAGALQWSVVEMLKRYRLFSEAGVRELEAYNAMMVKNGEDPLPRVVVIIDELADLMMVASKEVEESICRVAQMGRAAGMHLVVATQRPSADVITGLMKANIPSRIAFAVSSSMESRIILDQIGAEKLVGMGDMLFSPVGLGKPVRIQGAFVSDEEREDVINFIKETAGTTETNNDIAEFMDKAAAKSNEPSGSGKSSGGSAKASAFPEDSPASEYDEMLPQAVEVVLEMKQCSVSMLQRRLKLGYSRAARVVDQLEEIGVVGPYEGAKPRSVVIDRNGWQEMAVQLGYASDDDFAMAAEMSEAVEDEIP